jgi:hypothetical protein
MKPSVLAGQGSITLDAAMELSRPYGMQEGEALVCVDKRHVFAAAAFASSSKSREVSDEYCGGRGFGVGR